MILKSDLSVSVDRRLDSFTCMCTMVVSLECILYRWTCLAVSSVHKFRKPYLMALFQLEMTGEKRAT